MADGTADGVGWGPLAVSLCYYAYVFLLCEVLRRLSLRVFGGRSLPSRCLLEFLGSLEICACIFEGSIVGQYYGDAAYFASVAGVVWLHSYVKRPQTHCNPSSLFEEWLLGRSGLKAPSFLLLLLSECLAGFVAFHLARAFWRLEFSAEHGERFRDYRCTTDLAVGLGAGMAYEGGATLWDRLFWLLAEERLPEQPAVALGSLQVAATTLLGLSYTGMYFNPILASTMTLGCAGLGPLHHFLVYWAASFVGHLLGSALYELLPFSGSLRVDREMNKEPGDVEKKIK